MGRTWSTIIDHVLSRENMAHRRILRVSVSPRYAAVLIEGGILGVAYSYAFEEFCQPLMVEGEELGEAIVSLIESDCTVSRAIAQAAANAVGQYELREAITRGGTLSWSELFGREYERGARRVLFVGEIKKVPRIALESGFEVKIVDRNPRSPGTLPDYYYYKYAPKSDLIVVTGSAFARPDIDSLLDTAKPGAIIAVVGPSASLPPKVLRRIGVKYQASILIKEPVMVERLVRNNQGHRTFKPYVEDFILEI